MEIANPARTEAYADSLSLGFAQCSGICSSLSETLEARGWKSKQEYTTPEADNAPWIDPAEPYGKGFAGMFMLDGADAMNSSTWQAQANEALGDGGFVSTGRNRTREMTFRAILTGTDMHALQHGLNWLTTVLHKGDPCRDTIAEPTHYQYRDYLAYWVRYKDEASLSEDDDMFQGPLYTGDPHTYAGVKTSLSARNPLIKSAVEGLAECEGFRLEFFTRCPTVEQRNRYYRYFLDVHCTNGPIILSTHEVQGSCETGPGAWAEIEFTLVAANPFAYRAGINLARSVDMFTYKDLLPSGANKPWWLVYKTDLPLTDDNVYEAPLLYSDIRHSYTGLTEVIWRKMAEIDASTFREMEKQFTSTGPSRLQWEDPGCPPVPAFPGVPITPLLCHPPYEGQYKQFRFRAGTTQLPKFTEMAMLMEFAAVGHDFDDVRVRLVRFEGNPDAEYDLQMYLHHIPDGTTLRVDGRRRNIIMYNGRVGQPAFGPDFEYGPASHLVSMDATSASFRYPTLLCGGKYWVVVDLPTIIPTGTLYVSVLAIGRE